MNRNILFEQANKYKELGQFDNAIKSYEEAIQFNPNYVEAYYNLGELQHQLGNFDKAVRNFKKIVSISPEFSRTHSNKILLVIYHFSKGQIDDALETLNLLIESNSKDALLYNMMGGCYLGLRQFEMAIQNYEKSFGP